MVHSGFLPKDYSALVDEHAALIDAVIDRNPDLAEQLARSHNEAEVRLLSAHVEQTAAAS
jgi:DNA-binding GntR family transcriptional regulator